MKFTEISQNETKFTYKDTNFILVEGSVGTYGLGRCVRLNQLNGIKKEFVKCVGWTKSDNHGGPSNEVLLSGIVTLDECKTESVKYLEKLMS